MLRAVVENVDKCVRQIGNVSKEVEIHKRNTRKIPLRGSQVD
jgi:hypothetical protein